MSETLTDAGLTAMDLKAIKLADRISFHSVDGKSWICCTKELRNVGPFDDRTRDYKIETTSTFNKNKPENPRCFEMLYSGQWNEEWATIRAFLRKGDVLSLHWDQDGHRNGYTKRARITEHDEHGSPGLGMELHVDTLYLKIKRAYKRYSFLLEVSICPDNSARMIQ